jgi:hypothetical protein
VKSNMGLHDLGIILGVVRAKRQRERIRNQVGLWYQSSTIGARLLLCTKENWMQKSQNMLAWLGLAKWF